MRHYAGMSVPIAPPRRRHLNGFILASLVFLGGGLILVAFNTVGTSQSQVFGTGPSPRPHSADLADAVAITTATNKHFADLFAEGPRDFDTDAFAAWYQTAFGDQRCETDRARVPAGVDVTTWFKDCVALESHLSQWAAAALKAEPGPATAQMRDLGGQVTADLAVVAADVAALR